MNLIYSLACEVGLIKFESLHDSMAVTPSIESVSKAQKFAELIIRDCADICYNKEYAYGSAYGEAIEKHFGVK